MEMPKCRTFRADRRPMCKRFHEMSRLLLQFRAAIPAHLQEGATMKILPSILGVMTLLAGTASHGVSQVVTGLQGPVEFVGLQRWNAPDLLEAIQKIAPDQPLHACAATMKSELGFPDAAVFIYLESDTDWSKRYTVIVGVEDSTRVRYRPAGNRTIALPESWQALTTVAEEDFGTLVPCSRDIRISTRFREGARTCRAYGR